MSRTNEMTGGEALARMLRAHDVGPMFGMGGFQLLPFYDAVRRLGLLHHLINDERAGVFAADAYAKVTGRVGVCDATLGPGATNLVTGLVEALNAGTPLVVLTGDAHRLHAGKNMTQEARQIEILRPAVKEVLRIEAVERIPELVRRAFAIATSGRPGPVVLDVPEDVCHGTHPFAGGDFTADPATFAAPSRRCRPDPLDLERAAERLAGARRPLMLCGGGVHISGAAGEVTALAESLELPVAHTMSGKGAIACTHRLNAGLFGRYDRIANRLIAESDCLFVVGCKLGEIATKRYALPGHDRTLIHLDILPEEFGRTTAATLALWGDAAATLRELGALLADRAPAIADRQRGYAEEVTGRMAAWRDGVAAKLRSNERPVSMARLVHELNGHLPADALLIADGGFAAHWAGLLYDTKRPGRGFVPDRGFASIGYGLPGAIGAALAAPGRPVVALTGDGGFNMAMGELETAVRLGLAFTLVIVDNAASGYVKALQHLMYGEGAYQSSDLAPMNYARIAEAMGCRGLRVETPEEIAPALREGLNERQRPVVIDLLVTRDPSRMLPGVDSRAARAEKGDRIA